MSSKEASVSLEELTQLINLHLGDLAEKDPNWIIAESPLGGRGVFAKRNINKGEEIFREHTLLVGPTSRKNMPLNICVICYNLLNEENNVLCPNGCCLPVCETCSKSDKHAQECNLFRKWKPKDTTKIEPPVVRLLSVVRCFFLSGNERKLLYAMQANNDKYYMKEIQTAANCFENFPQEADALDYFYRTVCAYNTNAFQATSTVNGHEVKLRALLPLAGLLNHACTPNANHDFVDCETIVLSATRDIAKGEEITTTYTKVLWSNLTRKMFLAMTKHFMCNCSRCLDPTVSKVYFRYISWYV